MAKTFKCPFCELKFTDKEKLYYHIEKDHPEVLKDGYSAARVYFNYINKKDHGSCVICRKPTEWNEKTRKYMRFCSEECKNEYVKQMKNRMINVYGKVHLLNDPKKQREMLSARSISGEYEFKDGGKHSYTGSYERSFLEFLDKVMEFSSLDVVSPCPFTFYYTYEGKELFYIPDIYIPSLNLIVEIKDGGDNPNTHPKIQAVDKIKEKLKDDLMKKGSYNYIKITNKDNFEFIEFLIELKNKDDEDKKPIIRIAESEKVIMPYRGVGPLKEAYGEEEINDVRNYPYIAYRLDEEIGSYFPTDTIYLQDPLDHVGLHCVGKDKKMKSLFPHNVDNTNSQWVIVTNIYPEEFKDMSALIDGFLEALSGGTNIVLKRSYKDDKNIRFTWDRMRENYNRILEEGVDNLLEFKADPTETVIEEFEHGCKLCKDANGKYYYRDEMGHCTDKANSKEGINFWQRALINLKHRRGDYRKGRRS